MPGMPDTRRQLDITLTEPVIFLRSSDPSGRHEADQDDSPALVRGILTLNVVKPIGISSIEVDLTGLLTVSYPEGVASRHTDFHEKHKIYSSTVTVFRAEPLQAPRMGRPASVGPGLSPATPNRDHEDATLSHSPSSPQRHSERQSDIFPAIGVTPDLGPTPPYTSVPQPQPPTPTLPRVGVLRESPSCPAQTLEELRQALRCNLVGQAHENALSEQLLPPSPCQHSITLSPPNSTTRSSASIASNEPFHQESDNVVHTNSPFSGDTSYHSAIEELPRTSRLHHRSSSCRPSLAHSRDNIDGVQPQARPRANSHDYPSPPGGRSRLRLSLNYMLDAVKEVASRAPPKSRAVAGSEEKERGRTRVRTVTGEQSRGSTQAGESSIQLEMNASNANGNMEHRERYLLGLGRVLGLHRDHEKEKDTQQKSKEQGDGWREFTPGTYSYPFSFVLPPNLPPTFSIPHGSLNYTIKSVAHRPGTFKSKLCSQVPLLVVSAPAAGAGEGGGGPGDPGPIFIQRQWEGKLAYSFALSSRLFIIGSQRHLGTTTSDSICANIEPFAGAEADGGTEATYGTATLDLTLLPIEKVRIWRLSVFVDQHARYLYGQRKVSRDEDTRRVTLLELQDACPEDELGSVDEEQTHKNKHKHKRDSVPIPLLPTPVSPHRSPLLRLIPPSADSSILAGPGPYTLSAVIGLPDCNDALHFTVKQRSSIVKVEHSLRIVMRVERVDDSTDDQEEGDKKRFFDITVQAPISVLSCRCAPEYQTLPRYSETDDGVLNPACPCQPRAPGPMENGQGNGVGTRPWHVAMASGRPSYGSSSIESTDGVQHSHSQTDEQPSVQEHSRSSSQARRSCHSSQFMTPLTLRSHSPSPARTRETDWSRSPIHAQFHPPNPHRHSYSVSTSNGHVPPHATPVSTPYSSRPPSPVARFERLVSGLESAEGEAPPSYESIASRP